MNYTDKLNLLLEKYNLKRPKNNIEIMNDISRRFLDNINRVSPDKKVAIWGAGEHTLRLVDFLPDNFVRDNLRYIIDSDCKKWGGDCCGFTIISPDTPVLHEVDIVIISAISYRQEIRKEIEHRWPTVQIIDIYDGYDEIPGSLFTTHVVLIHSEIASVYKYYLSCENEEERERCLLTLIKLFLNIRDILYAKKFIEIYISNCYSESGKMSVFLEALDGLLDAMKRDASKSENKIVCLFVWDALRNDYVKNSKFLSERFENGISFPNAYSFGTHTFPALQALLKGDVLPTPPYHQRKAESEFLDQFTELGYKFYVSNFVITFSEKYDKITDTPFSYFNLPDFDQNNIKHVDNMIISEHLWYLADYLIQNGDKNILALVRFCDIHGHFSFFKNKNVLLPMYNLTIAQSQAQRELYQEIIEYMDEQMCFYRDFFKNNTLTAYLSDHGCSLGENTLNGNMTTWFDHIAKVVMVLDVPRYPHMCIQNLFPNYHLLPLLWRLLREEDFSDLISEEFVVCSRERMRNPLYRSAILTALTGVVTNPNEFLESFDVVIGTYDKYIRYGSGQERYYIMPDEFTDCVGDSKFKGRVDRMRRFLEEKLIARREL